MDEASRALARAGTVEVEVEVDETTRKDRTRVDGEPGRDRDERLVESVRGRDAQFHRWRRHSPGVRSTRSVGGLGDDVGGARTRASARDWRLRCPSSRRIHGRAGITV